MSRRPLDGRRIRIIARHGVDQGFTLWGLVDQRMFQDSASNTVTPAQNARVLLVEDEEAIRELVTFHLELAHLDTIVALDGKEAVRLTEARAFDLVILDLVLPALDGISVCHAIRRGRINRDVPILILTARAEETDRVTGLESGADDCLTKPFGIRELMARIRALLRRPRRVLRHSLRGQPTVSAHGVTIDPTRRRVVASGKSVSLTPNEFRLLYLLASHPGVVFDRDELRARVWPDEVSGTSRGVDTLVKRLRRKIEADPPAPTRILTARGAGYKFAES